MHKKNKTRNNNIESQFYHIPVNLKNIITYFTHGLFIPVCCDTEEGKKNREKDSLSEHPEYIVLVKPDHDNGHIKKELIEVFLFLDEINSLKSEGHKLLFSKPIPISRVRKIIVRSEEQKSKLTRIAKTYKDSVIPLGLIVVSEAKSEDKQANLNFSDPKTQRTTEQGLSDQKIENFGSSIDAFNRMLGMLSFVRNVGRYYACQNNFYYDYHRSYFLLLNLLDKELFPIKNLIKENACFEDKNTEDKVNAWRLLINSDFGKDKTDVPRNELLKLIIENIYYDKSFNKETTKYILERIQKNKTFYNSSNPINSIFEDLFDFNVNKAIGRLHNTDEMWEFLILAVLYHYHHKSSSNDTELIKKDYTEKFQNNDDLSSLILATMGLYYGYDKLPAKEQIVGFSEGHKNAFGEDHPIKYTTLDIFERFTVETVYQNTFKRGYRPDYNSFISAFSEKNEGKKTTNDVRKKVMVYEDKDRFYIAHDRSFQININGCIPYNIKRYEISDFTHLYLTINPDSESEKCDEFTKKTKEYIKRLISNNYDKIDQSCSITRSLFQGSVPHLAEQNQGSVKYVFKKNEVKKYIGRTDDIETLLILLDEIRIDSERKNNKLINSIITNQGSFK